MSNHIKDIRICKNELGTYDLRVDGFLRLRDESMTVCENVADALRGNPQPSTECAEVAQSIMRPRQMQCCCCGESTIGRQWWNRDRGYGLCVKCADWIKSKGDSDADMESCYGVRGFHYDIKPTA